MAVSTNPTFNRMVTPLSYEAVAAVTGKRFVKEVAGKVTPCSVAGERAIGVALKDADLGKEVAVSTSPNIEVVTAGAAIAVDALVMTNTVGKAITATIGLLALGRLVFNSSAAADLDPVSVDLFQEPFLVAP